MKKRIVVVLGMHRSGTSIVSAALECLGVRFGSHLLGPREDNPKGFWEDEDFVELNERLYELGGSFSSALGFDAEVVRQASGYPLLFQRMKELLRARLDKESLFGLKDPRMPRLMSLWGEALEDLAVEVSFVVPLRNPLSVAASLAKRDEFPTSKSLLLWYEHMARALQYTSRRQMLVVDYDRFMDQPREALHRVAKRLGLEFDEEQFSRFACETLSAELRHSRFSDNDLRRHVDSFPALIDLYTLLARLAHDQAGTLPEEAHRVDLAFSELWPILRRCGLLDIELWGGAQHLQQMQESTTRREKELSGWIESLESTVRSGEEARLLQQASFSARESELQTWISRLEDTLRLQQASFSTRESELLAWIASLEGTVQAAEQERRVSQDWFQEQMLKLEALANQREQSIQHLNEKLTSTWEALQQIQRSRSWRLTRPLRWWGRMLRRS